MNRTKERIKMQSFQKKMIAGSLACALVLGGTVPAAFAAENEGAAAGAAAVATNAAVHTDALAPILGQRLQSIVSDVALLADKETSAVQEDLDHGQTLIQSSAMSAGELLDRLSGFLNQDIDVKLGSTLSAEEISKLKADGRAGILAAITTPGYRPAGSSVAVDVYGIIQKHVDSIVSDTAFYSDKEDSAISDELSKGYSLLQASGLSSADLLDRLLGSVNQDLDNAAASNLSADELEKAKSQAASKIRSLITIGGLYAFEQLRGRGLESRCGQADGPNYR